LIAAGGALLVFLCASMAVAGFVVGQRTAQARTVTETVTEIVTRTVTEISEVTREVIVIATPGNGRYRRTHPAAHALADG
jgi:archaellum component FlaG (FlaF/FlaG flagellin family)